MIQTHTDFVLRIRKQIKELPFLQLAEQNTSKIVETDALEISFGDILKQVREYRKQIVQYTSKYWNQLSKITAL